MDFDGVLHPTLARPDQLFEKAELLVEVLGRHEAQVVISSSWRFQMSQAEILEKLPSAMRPLVVGMTGAAHVGKHARWNEIQAYCRVHRTEDWRTLDDSAFEFPTVCTQLIRVDGAQALTARDLQQLTQWLSEQPDRSC